MKDLGLNLKTFYIDGCKAYYNAIRTVFGPQVAIQYDYFHILQNVWRHLGKWAVARRRRDQKPERESDHAMVQEETRDLGPEPVGEPLCAVQGRKANESRRKAALDRDRRGR